MVNVRPIRTEADYEVALARVAELMDSREGTPEGEEFDVLVDLVEVYEDRLQIGVAPPRRPAPRPTTTP